MDFDQGHFSFLTATSCPKKDFYPPPHQTFVLHTQNSATFVLRTQKSVPKSRPKKVGKKRQQKRQQKRWQKVAKKQQKKFIPEPVLLLA